MRQIVRNPHTDEPIAKATFARVFRRELAEGGARLKQLISSKYYEALREGRDWAIRAGLRNRFYCDDTIKITFVTPEQSEPIDITPPKPEPSPYANAAPDLSKPALEPPRPRFETGTGAIWEPPRKPTDWMG